jgi:glycosyltransferase involved in cell wall biosynthesis
LHARHQFEIVNAQLMPAARHVCMAFEPDRLPITKSDHGDTVNAASSDAVVFRRLDALVCPANANAQRATTLPLRPDCRVLTIPYGYRKSESATNALSSFNGVTFGMVARGVADKGWREAIAAARMVRQQLDKPMRLLLVGGGPAIDELQSELSVEDRAWITFTGQQSDPESWVRSFDVGLLPTCLPEESLPNAIIEYLACGKPVIATNVGGIASMIGAAGCVIPLASNGRADVAALAAAMIAMMDATHRADLAHFTPDAFARFDMATCVHAYEALFAQLLAR